MIKIASRGSRVSYFEPRDMFSDDFADILDLQIIDNSTQNESADSAPMMIHHSENIITFSEMADRLKVQKTFNLTGASDPSSIL